MLSSELQKTDAFLHYIRMATMSMARAGSASAVRQPSNGVMMMGVFVHPSHGVQFEASAAPSAPTTPMPATTAFVNPLKPAEDALPSQMDDLTLSSPSSPVVSEPESPTDYFSSRAFSYHRNSDSSFASNSSFSSVDSSAVTTPTCESPYPKAPCLSRRDSSFGIYPEASAACPSPQFPASFSFSTFAPASQPASRASSPPRGLPYARRGGSTMQRAVSSPVETQRALDLRTRAMSAASEMLHEQAGRVARSRSVVGLPGLGAAMSRTGSRSPALGGGCPSPLASPFEEGWGSALPLREPQQPELIPFPYNIAVTPQSPYRLARSNSYAATENTPIAPVHSGSRKASLPNTHLSGSAAPSSTVMSRPRRGTLTLAPLTPILPSSPLFAVEETSAFAAAVEHNSPHASPRKPSFHRGVTY